MRVSNTVLALVGMLAIGCGGRGLALTARGTTVVPRPTRGQEFKAQLDLPNSTPEASRVAFARLEGTASADGTDDRVCFTVEDYQQQPKSDQIDSFFSASDTGASQPNPINAPGGVQLRSSSGAPPLKPALLNGVHMAPVEIRYKERNQTTGLDEINIDNYWQYQLGACFAGRIMTSSTEWLELAVNLRDHARYTYRFQLR